MASFLDRLLGRPEPPKPSTKAVTSLGAWDRGIPLSSLADTPQQKAAAYLRAYKVGWFYKAGRKIADDVAALDWSVSDGDAEEDESESTLGRPDLRVPLRSLSPIDQFQRLLERPNPSYTGRQLLRKTEVRLDFAGAAAWYLEGATVGLPTAIYGISPARMWPSRDKQGNLIGWVMDKDAPSGGVPFDVTEILWFSTGNAADDEIWGNSVVEAVYSQVPITDLMARHTANVLTTGGRLAGMMWPRERSLGEDEFQDAQRAWRNVASDPDAARRLLIFPEPMEYATGASTPAEIGIPELATLNRDEILTAFPVSPYRLGVPTPGGLNSGEVRREDRRDYWEETIHPRADLIEETIQVGLLSRYEEATGQTFDFEIAEPNMDDATSLTAKVEAYKGLVSIGLDPKESLAAVDLGHIKWLGLPDLLDPAKQAMAQEEARQAQTEALQQRSQPTPEAPAKAAKERPVRGRSRLTSFLDKQRDRIVANIEKMAPAGKAERTSWVKADPEWWDTAAEDAALARTMSGIYVEIGRDGLSTAANTLGRTVTPLNVRRILADLLEYGGSRITAINETTKAAVQAQLIEGARRGYSISQMVDGVPAESFAGVKNALLDNGVAAFDGYRAEVIARTETMLSYNRAAVVGYKEFGVEQVEAIDGDEHDECADRNGQVFSVEEALAIEDHPNGTLDWIPIIGDKAAHYDPPTSTTEVHVHIPDTLKIPAPEVTVQPPEVTVNVPDVIVPEIKVPTVVVPEIKLPTITVPEPVVIDRGRKASDVMDVRIVDSTLPPRRKKVKRDREGRVTEVYEE